MNSTQLNEIPIVTGVGGAYPESPTSEEQKPNFAEIVRTLQAAAGGTTREMPVPSQDSNTLKGTAAVGEHAPPSLWPAHSDTKFVGVSASTDVVVDAANFTTFPSELTACRSEVSMTVNDMTNACGETGPTERPTFHASDLAQMRRLCRSELNAFREEAATENTRALSAKTALLKATRESNNLGTEIEAYQARIQEVESKLQTRDEELQSLRQAQTSDLAVQLQLSEARFAQMQQIVAAKDRELEALRAASGPADFQELLAAKDAQMEKLRAHADNVTRELEQRQGTLERLEGRLWQAEKALLEPGNRFSSPALTAPVDGLVVHEPEPGPDIDRNTDGVLEDAQVELVYDMQVESLKMETPHKAQKGDPVASAFASPRALPPNMCRSTDNDAIESLSNCVLLNDRTVQQIEVGSVTHAAGTPTSSGRNVYVRCAADMAGFDAPGLAFSCPSSCAVGPQRTTGFAEGLQAGNPFPISADGAVRQVAPPPPPTLTAAAGSYSKSAHSLSAFTSPARAFSPSANVEDLEGMVTRMVTDKTRTVSSLERKIAELERMIGQAAHGSPSMRSAIKLPASPLHGLRPVEVGCATVSPCSTSRLLQGQVPAAAVTRPEFADQKVSIMVRSPSAPGSSRGPSTRASPRQQTRQFESPILQQRFTIPPSMPLVQAPWQQRSACTSRSPSPLRGCSASPLPTPPSALPSSIWALPTQVGIRPSSAQVLPSPSGSFAVPPQLVQMSNAARILMPLR